MYHKPMTYIIRVYDGEPSTYGNFAVYFCSKDGKRAVQTFDTFFMLDAFTKALDGLGFKKKRR